MFHFILLNHGFLIALQVVLQFKPKNVHIEVTTEDETMITKEGYVS